MAEISVRVKKIAEAGAFKMRGEYTWRPYPGTEWLPLYCRSLYLVKKPDGTQYKVNVKTGTCNCPFFRKEGYCKHIDFLRAEIEWEMRAEQQAAEQLEAILALHDLIDARY